MINEYAGDVGDLENTYRALTADDLLQLSIEGGLSPEAETVLRNEMRRRSLGTKDVEELKNWEDEQKPPPPPPQRVFLGYGVRVVGKKYLSQEDESQGIFTATKFVVLKRMSIFPVGSYRMKQAANEFPQIENRIPLQWDQVWLGVKPAVLTTLIGFTLAAVTIYFKERK